MFVSEIKLIILYGFSFLSNQSQEIQSRNLSYYVNKVRLVVKVLIVDFHDTVDSLRSRP